MTLSPSQRERMELAFAALGAAGFSGVAGIDDGSPTPLIRAFGLSEVSHPELALFDICSVTKSMTAAAVLQLASQGRLSLDQTLDRFFDLTREMAGITIRQLLTHSSGLGDFLSPTGEPREYSLAADYEPLSRQQLLQQIGRSRLLTPPGERWAYSNTGYSLLAAIVEAASGEAFETHLRSALFLPHGMHHTGYTFPKEHHSRVVSGRLGSEDWNRPDSAGQPSWNLIGNGGLLSTISDLLRWRTAFGKLAESCTAPVVVEGSILSGYGCFFQTDSELGKVAYHNGSNGLFSATIRWYPESNRYLAVLGNRSDHSALPAARMISASWNA